MSLFIASLNSGSNGNCYYIGTETEAILVDAGISFREILRRMKRLGLDAARLKAVFISHEHSDHIRGIHTLSRKTKIPVYITPDTLRFGGLRLDPDLVRSFYAYKPIRFGNLSITAFPKFHDASDPYSFIIDSKEVKVGVFTDIGHACPQVIKHFSQCHAAFLESNYDEDMLENGRYPYYLKKRISSDKGHLSNKQALELFLQHRSPGLSHLVLSHLSENNNTPELVEGIFSQYAGNTSIIVASRVKETPVFHISDTQNPSPITKPVKTSQLQFSFT